MNRFFNKKILAFTLAEMMVVLALFSVISAATMPVITARQKMEGAASTSGGIEGDVDDPWTHFETFKGLAYYNASQPDTSAVMVGDEVTDSSSSLGKPSLIVVDKYGTGTSGNEDASQIGLFKDVSGVPYYGGRIMMSNSSNQSTGSIAIGASALSYNSNTTVRTYNTAIGSNALADNSSNTSKIGSVGIGASTLFGCRSAYSVAIGNQAGYKTTSERSVMIGNHAGYSSSGTGSLQYSVAIGDSAFMSSNATVSTKFSTAIGTYAGGSGNADNSTYIGYYAGVNNNSTDLAGAVGIGTRAMSLAQDGAEGVGIGYYASYDGSGNAISIGRYAGAWADNGGGTPMSSVYIGYRAGYYQGESENAVMIGHDAGYASAITTGDDYSKGPVFIGYNAGYRSSDEADGNNNFAPAVIVGHGAGSDGNFGDAAYSIYMGNHSGYLTQAYDAVCLGPYTCSDYQNSNWNGGFVGIAGKHGSWGDMTLVSSEKMSVIGDLPSTLRTSSLNTGNDLMLISPLYADQTPSTNILSSIILFGEVFSSKSSMTIFSDKRLKENIRPAKYGLNEVRKINVYNYNWKEGDTKTPQVGVIAQEVQKIIPESVHVDKDKEFGGYLTVDGSWFLYSMVNAIKDLDKQVLTIQKKLVAYTKEYVSLVQRVNKLEKEVKVLEKENKTLTHEVKVAYTKVKKAEKR